MNNISFSTNCANYLTKLNRAYLMTAAVAAVILAVALSILFAPVVLSATAFSATTAMVALGAILLVGSIAIAILDVYNKVKSESGSTLGYQGEMPTEEYIRKQQQEVSQGDEKLSKLTREFEDIMKNVEI